MKKEVAMYRRAFLAVLLSSAAAGPAAAEKKVDTFVLEVTGMV